MKRIKHASTPAGLARPTGPISFRVTDEVWKALSARAQELDSTENALARQYVVEALGNLTEREHLYMALTSLHAEISELRDDLSLIARTLLVSAGKVQREQAERWADTNLKRIE